MPKSKKPLFTCDDFRRWSLEEDNKKRRPYSRSLSRHESGCLACVQWMLEMVERALAKQAATPVFTDDQLALLKNNKRILDERIAELTLTTAESVDPDASVEGEPTLSDLANIETDE